MADPWAVFPDAPKAPAADAAAPDAWAAFPDAPKSAAPSIGVGEDLAKTALPSLARMGAGIVGLPGDLGQAAISAGKGLANMLGVPEDVQSAAAKAASYIPGVSGLSAMTAAPTSQQVQGGIEKITGPLYEPKTIPGKLLDTTVQFAPAVIGGPEAIAAKIGTRVLAPAAALEATKAVTDNPYAQVGAAIAGGALAHRLTAPGVAAAALPEAEQIRQAARAGYQHPDVAAVQIRPASVEALADRITADLNRRGQLSVPESAGATHNVVDRLRNTGTTPGLPQGVASIEELRSARSALGDMSTELNSAGRPTSNAAAAGRAGRQIDAYLGGLRQPDLVAGNAQRASEILRQANRDWAAASKSALVDLQQMKADRQAGRSGSGSNIENSMRQKIDATFGPGKETAAGLTAAERAAADRIVMGSPARNALRKFGKLGFSDGLSLLLHTGAAIGTGGLSVPLGIAGTIARKVGEGMTRRDIAALEEMMRSRSPEAQRWAAIQARIAAANPPQQLSALQGGLLSGAFAPPMRGILPLDQRVQQ